MFEQQKARRDRVVYSGRGGGPNAHYNNEKQAHYFYNDKFTSAVCSLKICLHSALLRAGLTVRQAHMSSIK